MDEFYIVRLWLDGDYRDLYFCQTLEFAKNMIAELKLKDKRITIHRMIRIDQITDELYVEAKKGEVVECEICGIIVKFKSQWTNFSSGVIHKNSSSKYCRQCHDRMMGIEKIMMEIEKVRSK